MNEFKKNFSAFWTDDDSGETYAIEGSLGKKNLKAQNTSRKVFFTLTVGGDVKNFSGSIDANRSRMKGHWTYSLQKK